VSSLDTVTTTDQFGPPAAPAPPRPQRTLRRSRTDRVGAGVAGGLGEYFRLDPLLFRVLFATAAFFGGAGLLLYLLAWAAIPEADTERSPIDGWIHGLRQRRAPFVVVAVAAVVLFWLVAFSWWAPGPALPVVLIIIVMVLIFGRRGPHTYWDRVDTDAPPLAPLGATASTDGEVATEHPSAATDTVSLDKTAEAPEPPPASIPRQSPEWVREIREWAGESRAASRARRRRAMPVKIAGLVTLIVALAILGLVDAVHGIAIPTYFWFALAIVGTAMLAGLVLRRTPWSLTALLIPILVGLIGLGGTHASLRDGTGQKDWRPTTGVSKQYRLAFGQAVLDLRALPTLPGPRTVDITVASGQVKVIAPRGMNITLQAEVHFGDLSVDGNDYADVDGFHWRGVNLDETVPPPVGALGPPLLVRVHLADGNVNLEQG
jgi:phage shock protein PspC (stress-responsive transcriptional regulator)